MKFISTDRGYINPRFVICIEEAPDEAYGCRARVTFMDGAETCVTRTDTPMDPEQESTPVVVAASPGFSRLDVAVDGDREVISTPIVAWRIHAEYAEPVCPDEADPEESFYGVRTPTGHVIVAGQAQYDSIGAFREDYIKLKKERQEVLARVAARKEAQKA